MTSAMTRNQVVSFIISVVSACSWCYVAFPPVTNLLMRMDRPWLVDLVSSLSVMTHFQPFSTGMVDSRDVDFFPADYLFRPFHKRSHHPQPSDFGR